MATRWERFLCRERLDAGLFDFHFSEGAAIEATDGDDGCEVRMPHVTCRWPVLPAWTLVKRMDVECTALADHQRSLVMERPGFGCRSGFRDLKSCCYFLSILRACAVLTGAASLQEVLCNYEETEARICAFEAEGGVGMLGRGGARQSESPVRMPGAALTLLCEQVGVCTCAERLSEALTLKVEAYPSTTLLTSYVQAAWQDSSISRE